MSFKKIIFCASFLFQQAAQAQQMAPIDLIINPLRERLAISGIGGFNSANTAGSNSNALGNGLGSSLQAGFDWNAIVKDNQRGDLSVFALSFKFNPILNTRRINKDSLNVKKLTLVDNEHFVQFGLRYRWVKNSENPENAKLNLTTYADAFYTPYKVQLDSARTAAFNTLNVSFGQQGAFLQDFSVGDLNFGLSLQGNYLQIINPSDTSLGFERAISNPNGITFPKHYAGLGGRVTFQFNDINVFVDMRKFWAINSSIVVPGLNDKLFLNFGAVVFGTAIKGRSKTNDDSSQF